MIVITDSNIFFSALIRPEGINALLPFTCSINIKFGQVTRYL